MSGIRELNTGIEEKTSLAFEDIQSRRSFFMASAKEAGVRTLLPF